MELYNKTHKNVNINYGRFLTRHHSFLQGIYHMPGATNDKPAFSHSSPSPTVILNEVKNRIVTKGKPQQRFFTSFRMTFFFFCHFLLFESFFGVYQ